MKRIRFSKGLLFRSIRSRLIFLYFLMFLIIFFVNLFILIQSRDMMGKVDRVFESNLSMTRMSDMLEKVQDNLYEYLNTRSSSALENFYRFQQDYGNMVEELNDRITSDKSMMLERSIRHMSEEYLSVTDKAILAKRGRNVEEYRELYEKSQQLNGYINSYIYELNSKRFSQNSENYRILLDAFKKLEAFSILIILGVFLLSSYVSYVIIHDMINPLVQLAGAANRVAGGDFEVVLPENGRADELGIVTDAFSKMLSSIRSYLVNQRQSLENEARLKEKELSMEAHLRQAQLRYLQAQINPHFLFNCLNAGAQLAMLEGADKTELFLGRMADFFRYNVKKTGGEASLSQELEAVDNYIYILNVRFAGDIHYERYVSDEIDTKAVEMPSMILQPVVENAIQHGIRDDLDKGRIELAAELIGADENETGRDCVCITVKDNGEGITRDDLKLIQEGRADELEKDRKGSSTGIALSNVMKRLELFYDEKNLLSIWSDGTGCGTEVTILLPMKRPGEAGLS